MVVFCLVGWFLFLRTRAFIFVKQWKVCFEHKTAEKLGDFAEGWHSVCSYICSSTDIRRTFICMGIKVWAFLQSRSQPRVWEFN